MPFPDWGSVPAWLGAGSLWLAFSVFSRDRANAARHQVDHVGIWFTPVYDRRFPPSERVEECEITVHARNASHLPVRVVQLAWQVNSRWMVQSAEHTSELPAYQTVEGINNSLQFNNDVLLPPDSTIETKTNVNVAHQAPEAGVQLDLIRGIECEVEWILIIDNAGRRWETHPGRPGRAKLMRWYHVRKEYQPRDWAR
ncbi:hypothetical protein AB0J43_05835 [Nonomuraea fuscirosea]